LQPLVEILKQDGHSVTVAPTTGPGMAGTLARAQIAGGADLIAVAGGDGTVNEVIGGMVGSDVPLAVLPAGTANVLGTEMKLGRRLEQTARRLGEFRPARISLGRLICDHGVDRHFLLMAGIGLDAHVVYHINVPLKARIGKLAYWVAGWSLLGKRLAEFDVEIEGRSRVCSFALATKVRNYGGDFEIARTVTLFDDCFEVVLFEGRNSLRYVKYFAGMVSNRLQGMSGVSVLHANRLILKPCSDSPVYVQVDGEFAGRLPAELRIVPDALTLLAPPEYACQPGHDRFLSSASQRLRGEK
jgi:diacylglycerol kinase family enzyme